MKHYSNWIFGSSSILLDFYFIEIQCKNINQITLLRELLKELPRSSIWSENLETDEILDNYDLTK